MVKAEVLEEEVWQEVRHLLENPHQIRAEYERRASDDGVKQASQIQERIVKLRRGGRGRGKTVAKERSRGVVERR